MENALSSGDTICTGDGPQTPQSAHPRSPTVQNRDALEEGEITEGEASSIALTSQRTREKVQLQLDTAVLTRLNRRTPSPVADSNRTSTPATSCHTPTVDDGMTAEDLDRAKSLVLDLLGWGVTPEYLVDYGVSAGALYRIFTDLRLRLPTNLVP
ncbi:hypothetical protein HYDPIDRAFT_40137 [Hydnomerulius pinastri MD-312]|uniref:Uncharacterized protein n=1 Tax=Hydnomerulius pinastri MD-312 TaxID=994086 RepID=A0A0C9WG82_9AGAM|nr:hypothetical protein HYDPIDRAFT_40137 [Hydnomerulius pinastri MD-312]